LFYIKNVGIQRKVSVEIRKINSTNNMQGGVCEDYETAQNVGVAPLAKAQFLGYNCVVCCFIEEVRFV
jgi:hypothetical protein